MNAITRLRQLGWSRACCQLQTLGMQSQPKKVCGHDSQETLQDSARAGTRLTLLAVHTSRFLVQGLTTSTFHVSDTATSPEQPLKTLSIIGFLIGVLVGFLIGRGSINQLEARVKQLEKQRARRCEECQRKIEGGS